MLDERRKAFEQVCALLEREGQKLRENGELKTAELVETLQAKVKALEKQETTK